MAPVVLELNRQGWADVRVVATAQHREMLDQVLALFDIKPDIDLDLMRPNQSLAALSARLYRNLDRLFEAECPALVLAQGDTTTVMVAAVVAFYRGIAFGHVEAGLRTHDRMFPFPEEMNRVFAGYLASLHFAPTQTARRNLLSERVADSEIHVTGNTVIDALFHVRDRLPPAENDAAGRRLILVTAHRRENFGKPMESICRALGDLLDQYADVDVLWPVHPNPNVSTLVWERLGCHPRVTLTEPLDYREIVAAMNRAHLVLTDSGGIQEEAPALAKPVLVLRAQTERPEAVEHGVVELVGTDRKRIVASVCRLLDDDTAYRAMAVGVSPYGDGNAAERIANIIRKHLGVGSAYAPAVDRV